MRPTLAIVTPWKDHPELRDIYVQSVQGADRVSIYGDQATLEMLVASWHFHPDVTHFFRYPLPGTESGAFSFGKVMNYAIQRQDADIIICLNNDVMAHDGRWIERARYQIKDDALYGPAFAGHSISGLSVHYLEGWCIGATRKTWNALGGFDTERYVGSYYEDADLSFRAMLGGMRLVQTDWQLQHLSNTTSRHTPGAYDHSEANRATFFRFVREQMERAA